MNYTYNQSSGQFVGLVAGIRPILLIRDPKLIRNILISDFKYFHDRGMYTNEQNDPLTNHLAAINGEKWKSLRKKLTPAFSIMKVSGMYSTIVNYGQSLISYLDDELKFMQYSMTTIDVTELMYQFTINVIASVAFGIEIDCIKNKNEAFRKCGRMVIIHILINNFFFNFK